MQLAQKIIVADDHPLFRTALQQAVSQIAPDAEIVQAESLPELQTVVEGHTDTDLILLDLNMPGAHGYSLCVRRLITKHRGTSLSLRRWKRSLLL